MLNVDTVGVQHGQAVAPHMNLGTALTGTRAILYLFQKKFIPTQYRRSYSYNFNGEFQNELATRMEKLNTLSGGGWNQADNCMYGESHATSAVMPLAQAMPIYTNELCESWSFILLIRNNINAVPFAVAGPTIQTNEIYSGFALDEPFPTNILPGSMSNSYNPNCMLRTMHYTKFDAGCSVGRDGFNSGAASLMQDLDLILPMQTQQSTVNGSTLYDLRPSTISNGIQISNDYSLVQSNDTITPLVTTRDEPLYVPTMYNNPRQHLGHIVDSLSFGVRSVSSSQMNSYDVFTQNITPADVLLNNFSNNIASEFNHTGNTAIKLDQSISLGELIAKYPDINIQRFEQPSGMQFDVKDSGGVSRTNSLSFILTSALPGMIAKYSFASITFNYCSWKPDAMGKLGIMEITDVRTLYDMDDITLANKIEFFKHDLAMDIFPIIRENGGEFYINCNCSVGGETQLNFQLMDFPSEQVNGFISIDNKLGGLISPLVGESGTATTNQSQLAGVIRSASETNRIVGMPDAPFGMYNNI